MRKAVLLVLVAVLALTALAVAGCGGGGTDQAAVTTVQGNLAKIDTAIKDMTAKGVAGTLTVADIKSARDTLKPEVQSVIDNGTKIEGADTGAVQKAWTELDTAVNGLSDSATLQEAGAILLSKVTPLQTALTAVKTAIASATK